ncbi:MAG: hypothetical protein CL780_01890 [Chloroflexi bacterium]|nr:hypothetical protein [Chloroflexota bacterium]|tara:strand:+ start:189 stop:485 length:297 start_codon:yes stop_codon:yes gene_type:complete
MKIKSIRAIYPDYHHIPKSWRTHLWQIIVRIETDTGHVGWGNVGGGKSLTEIVNGHFAEFVMGSRSDNRDEIWIGAPKPSEGRIELSDKSGFGIEPKM